MNSPHEKLIYVQSLVRCFLRGRERYGELAEFQAIDPLHRRVHDLGLEILSLKEQGRLQEAEARLGDLESLREALLAALDNLISLALCPQ
jgi:hypothetical protein